MNKLINDGGAAFPILADVRPHMDKEWCGMTLRDYFAAKAMAAILSRSDLDPTEGDGIIGVSICAYAMADAMLRARDESNSDGEKG